MRPRLVLPGDVERAVVDVLDRRHREHLAAQEERAGLRPRTYEPFATVVRMSDAAAIPLAGDTMPAVLLGTIGAPSFVRNEDDAVDAVYTLGMQISVMGQKRRDTLDRRDVYTWTLVECLYQRLPRGRGSLINSLRLTDYEPVVPEADAQRTLADARLVWEVGVPNVLSITGGLPADDISWPPEAGGAPVDPYDPIPDRPHATTTVEIDRKPIVE